MGPLWVGDIGFVSISRVVYHVLGRLGRKGIGVFSFGRVVYIDPMGPCMLQQDVVVLLGSIHLLEPALRKRKQVG